MKGAPPDFDAVLRAAAALQRVLPDAVLVGGTAAAFHVGHRHSGDADHTLGDLRERFAEVMAALDAAPQWEELRRVQGVLLLGNFEGVPTGVRQLIRSAPLETVAVAAPDGAPLRVPTPAEMLRIKAWLALTRNYGRDYLDAAALADALGEAAAPEALLPFDACYADVGPSRGLEKSPLRQLLRQLSDPRPALDGKAKAAGGSPLHGLKDLRPPWDDWEHVRDRCLDLAARVMERLTERPDADEEPPGPGM